MKGEVGTSVYRYYDEAGRLLYVGISSNPPKRQSQHKGKPWFRAAGLQVLTHYETRAEAAAAEAEAIRCEYPMYNVALPHGYKPLTDRQMRAWELWRSRSRWPHREAMSANRRSRAAEEAERKKLELMAAATAQKRKRLAERLWAERTTWRHRLHIRREREYAVQRAAATMSPGSRITPDGLRVVRLDELTEPQRRVVLSLISAAKTAPEAALR